MPDISSGQTPSNTPKKPQGEFSMERNMLLALVLMGAVLIGSQYLFRLFGPPPEETPVAATATPGQESAEAKPADAASSQGSTSQGNSGQGADAKLTAGNSETNAPVVDVKKAEAEQTFTVETELAKVVFSNRGAVVQSWTVKAHKDTEGRALELVNQAAFAKLAKPFAIQIRGVKPPVNPNQSLFVAEKSADGRSIDFVYSENGWTFRKHFQIAADSYRAQVRSEVLQGTTAVPHVLEWRGGFGDSTVDKRQDHQSAALFDQARGKLETRTAGDAEDGPVSIPGAYAFAGVQDKYFAAMFLPASPTTMDLTIFADSVRYNGDKEDAPSVGISIGGSGENDFELFVGPKNIDILKAVHPKLTDLVDFGWFFFIAEPLFLALNWLNDNYLHNFGWAIVVLTVAINFVLLPLKITSMKSMKKMQALQPQIAAINERYKGVSLRDPRKQKQNQEVMELYTKNGVNPAAGCVPVLLQIPFFFAFYQVLSIAIELRGANWLWVDDLSRPETLAIRILPLTMVVSQIVMQRLTPSPSTDPAQKMMMNTMPIVFGFIFWWASSGLVLYWLTSNLVGIVQQLFINRFTDASKLVTVPADAKQAKRIRK